MRQKPLKFKELLATLAEYPSKSIHMRDLGGNKIEIISVVNGHVTRLGYLRLPKENTVTAGRDHE